MNKGPAETVEFIEAFLPGAEELSASCEIVIAPPFVCMSAAAGLLTDSVVALSAQNVSEQEEGAYTGEWSAEMLAELGCRSEDVLAYAQQHGGDPRADKVDR